MFNLLDVFFASKVESNTASGTQENNIVIDSLTVNCGFTALAIAIGWFILKVLEVIESISWGKTD